MLRYLAQAGGTIEDLKSLGIVAFALIVGAAGTWLAIIKGFVRPERDVRAATIAYERARADKATADLAEINSVIITQVVPALERANQALESEVRDRRDPPRRSSR